MGKHYFKVGVYSPNPLCSLVPLIVCCAFLSESASVIMVISLIFRCGSQNWSHYFKVTSCIIHFCNSV